MSRVHVFVLKPSSNTGPISRAQGFGMESRFGLLRMDGGLGSKPGGFRRRADMLSAWKKWEWMGMDGMCQEERRYVRRVVGRERRASAKLGGMCSRVHLLLVSLEVSVDGSVLSGGLTIC